MTGQTAIEAMSQSRRLSGGTTKAPEGGLGSSADADTHRATDGAVLGVEQWGWRVRFKADARRDAGPWSWQDQPLDEKTQQWAEQEPVYVGQQAATRDDTQPGTEKPSGFAVDNENHEALREKVLGAVRPVLDRTPMIDSSNAHKLDIQAGWITDGILAVLQPKGWEL